MNGSGGNQSSKNEETKDGSFIDYHCMPKVN